MNFEQCERTAIENVNKLRRDHQATWTINPGQSMRGGYAHEWSIWLDSRGSLVAADPQFTGRPLWYADGSPEVGSTAAKMHQLFFAAPDRIFDGRKPDSKQVYGRPADSILSFNPWRNDLRNSPRFELQGDAKNLTGSQGMVLAKMESIIKLLINSFLQQDQEEPAFGFDSWVAPFQNLNAFPTEAVLKDWNSKAGEDRAQI